MGSIIKFGENTSDDYNSSCEDCLIYETNPTTNYDTQDLYMGKGGDADRTNRSVIRFNIKATLESLGASSITSAKLYFYPTGITNPGSHTIKAYRIFQDWNESQVTWNSWKTGSSWNTAGCASANDAGVDDGADDRKATAESSDSVITTGSYSVILDITSLAGEWLAGTSNEYGVLLQNDNEAVGEYVGGDDSEGADSQRPYLEVEYEVVTAAFTFSNISPVHLSTVYGTTQTLSSTVTVSGEEPAYVYNATFYTGGNVQIGSTVSGIDSGGEASVVYSTPSGIDYTWKVTATASGSEDTSSTYTFTNRFLCAGTVVEAETPASGIPVRLYRRSDGALVSGTVSTAGGVFQIETPYNENHYAIALHPDDDTNALIYDWLSP